MAEETDRWTERDRIQEQEEVLSRGLKRQVRDGTSPLRVFL